MPDKDQDPIELYREAMDHRYTPGYWASTWRWIYQPFFKPQNLSARQRVGAVLSIVGLALMIAVLEYPPYSWLLTCVGVATALGGWYLARTGSSTNRR